MGHSTVDKFRRAVHSDFIEKSLTPVAPKGEKSLTKELYCMYFI